MLERNIVVFYKKLRSSISKVVSKDIFIRLFFNILALFFAIKLYKIFDLHDYLDITVFTAAIAILLIDFFIVTIINFASMKREDSLKTTDDYRALIKKYPLDRKYGYFYEFNNTKLNKVPTKIRMKFYNDDDNFDFYEKQVFPVWQLADCRGKEVVLRDSEEVFQMNESLKENLNILNEVHKNSNIYNNKNIRLDNVTEDGNRVILKTSRTTYFDFCASNRMIDYVHKNKRTIRNDLLYGPLFPSLSQSPLSNLLGFNCSVISSDGYLIFIKRGSKVSIEKNKLGLGVQASIKYMYTHAEEGKKIIDMEDIYRSVEMEFLDELGVTLESPEKINNKLVDVYYDYVEGKPQLYFEVFLDEKDKNSSLKDISAYVSRKDKSMTKDGNSVIAIPLDRAENIYVSPFALAYENQYYSMVPSASYCAARFLENIRW